MKSKYTRWTIITFTAFLNLFPFVSTPATAELINLALNPSGIGFPSPLESDQGWGGGSYPWEIVDGLHSYSFWAHGLAFTGGHQTAAGGPPWIEPAGWRQATIDFGEMKTFEKVIIWHHGVEYTPAEAFLDYWDGTQWVPITFTRQYGTMHEEGQNSGYSDSDIYTFAPVTGSKVRYSFDNSGYNILGTFNIHGWIYEFEVFGANNEPPDCSAAAPSVGVIWPPNHKGVPVNIVGVTGPDDDVVSITIDSISQDEPVLETGTGSGNTCPDAAGVGTDTAVVRAERAGNPKVPGDGRVYHITFTADDGMGGTCTGEVTVCVPHDQRPGHVCVDQGPLFDSTVCP